MQSLTFDLFGRQILVTRSEHGWTAWTVGPEGKRRPAPDLVIPAHVSEADMALYLADLCHEWATERHPDVKRLD